MADKTHATSKHYPDMTEPIAKSIEEEKLTLVKTATSTNADRSIDLIAVSKTKQISTMTNLHPYSLPSLLGALPYRE